MSNHITNGGSASSTIPLNTSLLLQESYDVEKFGILDKHSLLQAFNEANNYNDPIKNIHIRYFDNKDNHFALAGEPPAHKNNNTLHDDNNTLHNNDNTLTYYKRLNSVDCLTEFKRDSDHICNSLSNTPLSSLKNRIKDCISNMSLKDKATVSPLCKSRFCPICGFNQYKIKSKQFELGLHNLMRQGIKIPYVRFITIKFQRVPIEAQAMLNIAIEATQAISKAITKSKYTKTKKNPKGLIIGTSRSLEFIQDGDNHAFPHIHLLVALRAKTPWITQAQFLTQLKKYTNKLSNGIGKYKPLHFRDLLSAPSLQAQDIINRFSYIHKAYGLSTEDQELGNTTKLNLNIPIHFRPSNSKIRSQSIHFYRAYIQAMQNFKLQVESGIFKEALASGKQIYKEIKSSTKSHASKPSKVKPIYASWSPKLITDNTGKTWNVGEYTLSSYDSKLLCNATIGTNHYLPSSPPQDDTHTSENIELSDTYTGESDTKFIPFDDPLYSKIKDTQISNNHDYFTIATPPTYTPYNKYVTGVHNE